MYLSITVYLLEYTNRFLLNLLGSAFEIPHRLKHISWNSRIYYFAFIRVTVQMIRFNSNILFRENNSLFYVFVGFSDDRV